MLNIHPAILISLGFCMCLLVLAIFEQHIVRILIRGSLGMMSMVLINYFTPYYIDLPFNIWAVGGAILFGIPGIILLYIFRLFIVFV